MDAFPPYCEQLAPASSSKGLQGTSKGLNPIHSQRSLELPSEQPQSAAVETPVQPRATVKTKNNGRKKIKIVHIEDDRSRQVTFLKRKNGILKKAHELSVLCGCDVAVIVFNNDNGKLYEYFNPSAEKIFLRYSSYTGPSERRRSDVMEHEGFDIPNKEPKLATAAASAADMAALRHANPENYEHPPPNLKRLHPNVGVPPVQVSSPPTPVHPAMPGNSLAGSSCKRSISEPTETQALDLPRTGITGSSKSLTPTNLSRTIQALSSQMLPPSQTAGKSQHRNTIPTASSVPQVARSLLFHSEQQPITPHTASNQIAACFGLTTTPCNDRFQHMGTGIFDYFPLANYTGSPSHPDGSAEGVDRRFGNTAQRDSLDYNLSPSHYVPYVEKDLEVSRRDSGTEPHTECLEETHQVAPVIVRPPGLEFSSNNRSIEMAATNTSIPAQTSPSSLKSPWAISRSSPRQSTSGITAEELWNSPSFRENVQEGERFETQLLLPPLTPFLSKGNPGSPGSVIGKKSLQKQFGSDVLPSPCDAGLIPLSSGDPIHGNSVNSVGERRLRSHSSSLPDDKDSKMRRLK